MSEDLRDIKRAALEAAIQEYMAECGDGAYLTDWVVFAAGADPAGSGTQYGFWASTHSAVHSIRGLIEMGQEEIYENSICVNSGEDDVDD